MLVILPLLFIKPNAREMAKNSEELAMHYRELTKARPVSGDPQKVIESYDELAATYDEVYYRNT